MTRLALVTTAWFAGARPRHAGVLSAFLLYHAALGVAKSFVFLDGARGAQLGDAQLHPHVRALIAAGRVELRYRRDPNDKEDEDDDGDECGDVPARQMRNAALAMRLCLQHNERETAPHEQLRWLLHLDVDELLYLEAIGGDTSPRDALDAFVAALEEQQPPVLQLTLANYEAVPTRPSGGVYFQRTTTFRRHHARVPLTREAHAALAFWRRRSRHEQFFLFYDNGKAVVRVQAGVTPASVHHWRHQQTSSSALVSRTNFFDARRNVAHADVLAEPQACVLHYPVCGLEWLREKYERLGDFPDVWGGAEREMTIAPCFHTQARDVVWRAEAQEEEGRRRQAAALEELYLAHVMLDVSDAAGAAEWRRQVAAGVCEEIRFPAELLGQYELGDASEEDQQLSSLKELPAAAAAVPSTSNSPEFTVEKAWMLAAISQQYLQPHAK